MTTGFFRALLVSSVISSVLLSASITNPNAKEPPSKDDSLEGSWSFYYDVNTTSNTNTPSKRIAVKGENAILAELLAKILEEQKKQTALQVEIRDLLQEEINPKPKMITNKDGKKCIANSSADCFDLPLISEAKKVPVMAAFIKNPTVDTASQYLKWQATYFNHLNNVGFSLNLAGKQYGEKAYPTSAITAEFGSYSASSLRQQLQREREILQKKSKNMQIYILLGKSPGFELEYPQKIFEMRDAFKALGIDTKIVFKDTGYLEDFKKIMSQSQNKAHMKQFMSIPASDVLISASSFGSLDPHATPYVVLRYTGGPTSFNQTIAVGKDDANIAQRSAIRALIINNAIEPKELNGGRLDSFVLKEMIEDSTPTDKDLSKTLDSILKTYKGKE